MPEPTHESRRVRVQAVGLAILAAMLSMVLVACANAGSGAASAPAGAPTVEDAWVRPALGPDLPAAGYLRITGAPDRADTLVGITSPVAGSVELHQTMADASGMLGMHPVDELPIPAGTSVVLEPGGYHLMLLGLTSRLEIGSTVELVLEFASAGSVTVQAAVREG